MTFYEFMYKRDYSGKDVWGRPTSITAFEAVSYHLGEGRTSHWPQNEKWIELATERIKYRLGMIEEDRRVMNRALNLLESVELCPPYDEMFLDVEEEQKEKLYNKYMRVNND